MPDLAYRQVVLRDRPIALWLAPGPSGTVPGVTYTVAGTIPNKPGTRFGVASEFVGGTGFVTMASTRLAAVTDSFTLEAWCRRRATSAGVHTIMSFGANGGCLRWSNNFLELLRSNVIILTAATRSTLDLVTYHHVVGTKNGTAIKIYLNGQDVTGSTSNAACQDGDATDLKVNSDWIGSDQAPGTQDLTNLAVYNYPLSKAQVRNHYLTGVGRTQGRMRAA
jgi:concanavalin A-like lectin/glucanase superfamily protein